MFSKKATKNYKIFTVNLTLTTILSIFVTFLENNANRAPKIDFKSYFITLYCDSYRKYIVEMKVFQMRPH